MTGAASPAANVGQPPRPYVRRPWPRLPLWFRIGVVVTAVGFIGLTTYAVQLILEPRDQPLFERRSPPRAGAQSHDVGRVVVSAEVAVPVPCGSITGLAVAGDADAGPLLREAVTEGVCKRLPQLDPAVTERVAAAARRGVVISFGVFERTGDDSTTLPGVPSRIVVNTRFAGAFKAFLLPILVHELWHGGSADVTAVDELAARRAEVAMCALIPSSNISRSCEDARAIVQVDETEALRLFRAAGYR